MSTAIEPPGKRSGFPISARFVLLGFLLLVVSYPVSSQRGGAGQGPGNFDLPALNVLQSTTLSPSYSCHHDLARGFQKTALFLSDYSRQRNSPELLFNGACGSPDYFDVNTNGDEMSLIGDLGRTPIATVTAHKAFNLLGVDTPADYTKFSWHVYVVQGHTYAVAINSGAVRGLLVFTVVKYLPNQQVDLQFELKDYELLGPADRSPGFDWNK